MEFNTPFMEVKDLNEGTKERGEKNYGLRNPTVDFKSSKGGFAENQNVMFDKDTGAVEFDYEERYASRLSKSSLRLTVKEKPPKSKLGIKKPPIVLGEVFINLVTLLRNRRLRYDITLMKGLVGDKVKPERERRRTLNITSMSATRNIHVSIYIEMTPYVKTGIRLKELMLDASEAHGTEFGACPWVAGHVHKAKIFCFHMTMSEFRGQGTLRDRSEDGVNVRLKLRGADAKGNYVERIRNSTREDAGSFDLWIKDSLTGMRSSYIIFEVRSKRLFSTTWTPLCGVMLPLRDILRPVANGKAKEIWFRNDENDEGCVQLHGLDAAGVGSDYPPVNAFLRFKYDVICAPADFVPDSVLDRIQYYVPNEMRDGVVAKGKIRSVSSPPAAKGPSSSGSKRLIRRRSLADTYERKFHTKLSSSQSSMLDALQAARNLVKSKQMSRDEYQSFESVLKLEARLPGLASFLGASGSVTKSPAIEAFDELRSAVRRKNLRLINAALCKLASCKVPPEDEIRASGAGRLLDKISKHLKNEDARSQARSIMSKWKHELKRQRSTVKVGKNVFRDATSPVPVHASKGDATHRKVKNALRRLMSMGFERGDATNALQSSNGDANRAAAMLLSDRKGGGHHRGA
eukprot:g1674.t1